MPATDAPFRASATLRQLPGLRILNGTSPAATYRRSVTKIEADDVALQFGSSDDVAASLRRRETEIASYDAFLLPCGDSATIHLPQVSWFITLRLPYREARNTIDMSMVSASTIGLILS